MKIYFAGSIRGGREDAELYQQFISYLKNYGEVLTEHVGDPLLTERGDDGPDDRYIHDRDVQWLKSADVLIAEVSTVSMGVGYEIGRAVEAGMPVVCLYQPAKNSNVSAMITGCPQLSLVAYDKVEELQNRLIEVFEKLF